MSLRAIEVLNAVAAIRRKRRTRQRRFPARLAFHYRLNRARHGLGPLRAFGKAWWLAR